MRSIQNSIANILILFTIVQSLACLTMFEEKQETKDLLPSETELYTWKLIKSNTIKDHEKIKELFPQYYVHYGIDEIVIAEYRSINNDTLYITITIAKTKSLDDAYALFTRERVAIDKPFFNNGYSWFGKNSCVAFKGNIVVKIETNDTDFIQTQKNIVELILQKIQTLHTLPSDIERLSKFYNSDTFVVYNEGIAAIPYLIKVIVCKRSFDSLTVDVYYKHYSTVFDASRDFEIILKNDTSFMLLESDKVKICLKRLNDDYIFIASYKEWIVGTLVKDVNLGKKIMNTLIKELGDL